jgi:sugar lactone lactonase YvrE
VTLNRLLPIAALCLLTLAIGCGQTQQTGPAFTLYAVQNSGVAGSSVIELPLLNGETWLANVTPSNTISSPSQTPFQALTVDTAGNLYVSASTSTTPAIYEILVYAPTATGAATPTRTITSASLTALATSIAVDATGEVYALSGNSISVFAASATGTSTPVRLISGNLTLLNSPSSIAVDAAQNIYVANTNGNNVLVFSSTATGNVAPAGILSGAATGIGTPSGVALDSAGDIYVASFNQPSNSSLVVEFAPAATGNATPTRMLTAVASDTLAGLAVDALDNLYVFTQAPTTNQLAVAIFTPDESGSTTPAETITATSWTASTYGQIAVR